MIGSWYESKWISYSFAAVTEIRSHKNFKSPLVCILSVNDFLEMVLNKKCPWIKWDQIIPIWHLLPISKFFSESQALNIPWITIHFQSGQIYKEIYRRSDTAGTDMRVYRPKVIKRCVCVYVCVYIYIYCVYVCVCVCDSWCVSVDWVLVCKPRGC